MEFIIGEKFRNLSDNIRVFYCDTHDVNQFFDNIKIDNEFILITHNSDGKIKLEGNQFPDGDINKIPENLIKWYAQNVFDSHEKIESIPIGLENTNWFVEIGKINKIKNKIIENKNYKNLLYINHNIDTNIRERLSPYKIFTGKNFATCVSGRNGLNFDQYLDDVYNHKFVLCPEGNGIDTHRTWECLYLNSIPIEKRNVNNSGFNDLPICFVNDWEEINEEFLNSEYDRIINNKYDLSKLDFNYWRNKILL